MTAAPYLFRAMWPITDMATPLADLISEAELDLPMVAARARAAVRPGPGRWTIAPSARIPGSGRVADNVLLYEAPADRRGVRPICPRCRVDVFALVDGSGVCLDCDAAIDHHTHEEADVA